MIYTFGHFELDTGQQELRRAGVPLAVEPQVFDVIACLVENRNRLVTRDELIEAVWAGRFVSDTTVTSRIKAARQALEDNGQDQRVIRTAPRRGFRFVAEVALKREAIASAGASQALEGIARTLPDKPSVAVMPFANLSNDPEQELLIDGIVEDVIGALSRFTSLFVINRGSTFSYKGQAATAVQVSKDLGVRYIVEGTLRKSGNRVRITVQLVDAINNASLFSEQFDGVLDDVFELQDQITQKIVAAVAPGIERLERRRADNAQLAEIDTWLVYQKGLSANDESSEGKLVESIGYFDEVNRLDPKFGPAFAWGALARMALANVYRGNQLGDLSRTAKEKAELAYALDPAEPLALLAAARIQTGLGNHEQALAQASKAVEANANSAHGRRRFGHALLCAGQQEAALEQFDKALLVSPLDPAETMIKGLKAFSHFGLGEYDKGLAAVRSANAPKRMNMLVRFVEPLNLFKLGRTEEAREVMATVRADFPAMSIASIYAGIKYHAASIRDPVIATLRELGVPEE